MGDDKDVARVAWAKVANNLIEAVFFGWIMYLIFSCVRGR